MGFELNFKGAFDTVTESRTQLNLGQDKILVDCGLFQGAGPMRQKNREQIDHEADGFSAVFLTHAHLDHSGFIPRLTKDGFNGPIYSTPGTSALAKLILKDAGYLEEEAAKYANETRYSRHNPALPLFTLDDVEQCLGQFKTKARDRWHQFSPMLSYRFLRAGHIIGASMVQFQTMVDQKNFLITFSGDVGHYRSLTMKGPSALRETDILVLESTYGDRLHPKEDVLTELATIVQEVTQRGGVLLIPSFAVGRAQDLIYLFRILEDQKRIAKIPVILDSPMAKEATEIFLQFKDDQKVNDAFASVSGFAPTRFHMTRSPGESANYYKKNGPMVLISSSGMLSGGRILHHLKHRLSDDKNVVLFTGYQAQGTKGRWLQDHAHEEFLRIHHQNIPIKAQVKTLDALSAHADADDLLTWLEGLARPPKLVILNHGSVQAQRGLKEKIVGKFGWPVKTTAEQQHFNLNDLE